MSPDTSRNHNISGSGTGNRVFYPLLTTSLGEWWFARQTNGSLIEVNNEVKGSALIGQQFTQPGYFHGRPSRNSRASV